MLHFRRAKFQEASAVISSAGRDPDGPVLGSSRIGAELRAARLRLGWALPNIAAQLRIRLPFLEAIEDGRVADLPGNVYAVGFLRSYATLLGLDAAEMARRFRAEAHVVNRKTELAFPSPVPDRGVPAGAVVMLGVLLTLGAYVGWYRYSGNAQSAAEVVPVVPARLAPPIDRAAPPDPSPQVATVLPDPPTLALAAPMPVFAPPVTPPVTAPVTSPVAIAPDPLPVASITDGRVMLRFKADAWTQVRERQGQVLLNRIMRAGDIWPVPKGAQLLLSTGNAGGTELLVDGQPTSVLGPAGAVRRDVALDPDALKAASTGQPAAQ